MSWLELYREIVATLAREFSLSLQVLPREEWQEIMCIISGDGDEGKTGWF